MKKKLLMLLLSGLLIVPAVVTGQPDTAPKDFFGKSTNDLLVYPNPTSGSLRIVLNKLPACPVQVYVIDMNGVVAGKHEYAAGTYNIDVDLSTLPTGLYSIRVYGKDVDSHNLRVAKQ